LNKVKKYLKGWGFNLSGAGKKRKHTIQEELRGLEILEEHGALDEDHIRSRVDLNTELFQILEDEELYWYKRCHEDWLLRVIIILNFIIMWQMARKENKQYSLSNVMMRA
jgi:hypothetical protein